MKKLTIALAVLGGLALGLAVRAQDEKPPQKIEYVRVPLYSVFHPDPEKEAKLERGLYLSGPKTGSAIFRIPIEVPVGATVLEVGLVGQTTNQLSVRLERMDWTPVYAFGETQPKEAGSWSCLGIVDKGQVRRVGMPNPDDANTPSPRRDFEEQEFVLNVSLARSPNLSLSEKSAPPGSIGDKVVALWVKISKP